MHRLIAGMASTLASGTSDRDLNGILSMLQGSDAIEAGIAIVDKEAYWGDPDLFSDKADTWAQLFCKALGFKEYLWHWKNGSSGTFNHETYMDSTSGQWVIAFYDDLLFKKRGGLGSFILVTDDQSGTRAYFAIKFTHGSRYQDHLTPIPTNVKSTRALAPLLANKAGEWVADDLASIVQRGLVWDWSHTRSKGRFAFTLKVDGSENDASFVQAQVEKRMIQLGFKLGKVTVDLDDSASGPTIHIEATHRHRIFSF